MVSQFLNSAYYSRLTTRKNNVFLHIILRMKVKAFVFAAGLGTRLYPLTADRPKALVCYQGKTLLQGVVDKLIASGIHDIVVNVHHFPDQIIGHFRQHHYDAHIQISDERAYLRDTAGGLKFAKPFLQDSDILLLYNVDIISSINIEKLLKQHLESDADVTLAVRQRKTARYFVFNQEDMRLCGWKNIATGEMIMPQPVEHTVDLAFSGIHVMNTRFLQQIPSVEKGSITPLYLQNINNCVIKGFQHDNDDWLDVGKYCEFHNILT